MLNAIQQGILTRSTKERLDALEAARDDLEAKIACEKLAKPRLTEEQLMFFLQRFRKLDVTQPSHRKMLIDTFVNAIFLYDDKMVLTFNFREGTETITFADLQAALQRDEKSSNMNSVGVLQTRKPLRIKGLRVFVFPKGSKSDTLIAALDETNGYGKFGQGENFCGTTTANHDYDLYLISWVVSTRNGNKLVFETFTLAVWRYPDATPIFHSARGFQYASKVLQNLLKEQKDASDHVQSRTLYR